MFEMTLRLLAVMVVATTLIPLSRSKRWWVRIFDFPRFQILLFAVAILTLVPIQGWPPNALNTFLLTAVAFAGLWQLSWVWRYLPVAPREVPAARRANTCHGEIRLLTTN